MCPVITDTVLAAAKLERQQELQELGTMQWKSGTAPKPAKTFFFCVSKSLERFHWLAGMSKLRLAQVLLRESYRTKRSDSNSADPHTAINGMIVWIVCILIARRARFFAQCWLRESPCSMRLPPCRTFPLKSENQKQTTAKQQM